MNKELEDKALELRNNINNAKNYDELQKANLEWLNFLILYYKEHYDGA